MEDALKRLDGAIFAMVFLALAGCSVAPVQLDPSVDANAMPEQTDPDAEVNAVPPQSGAEVGAGAAQHAVDMVGTPYRWGGNTPIGFDCSGLVQYSYALAGVQLPRSTEELHAASRFVPRKKIRPGDLLFFHLDGRRNSHVGLYIGDGSFVHAPRTGKFVSTANLSDPFWRRHLAGARRPAPLAVREALA